MSHLCNRAAVLSVFARAKARKEIIPVRSVNCHRVVTIVIVVCYGRLGTILRMLGEWLVLRAEVIAVLCR